MLFTTHSSIPLASFEVCATNKHFQSIKTDLPCHNISCFNISTHFTTLHMMRQLISQLVINNEQKIWSFMHFLNFVFRQPKSVCPIRIWENKPRKPLLHNTFFLVHSHDKRTDCNCHSPHKGNSKTAAFSPQSDPISDVSTHHTKYHIR